MHWIDKYKLLDKQNLRFVKSILLILVLVLLVFWPSFTNDFQRAWDDQWMLLGHPMIHDQSFDNIWYYFTHFDRGQYFPLNQAYYILLYNIFGFEPMAFHAGSLLLHFVNGILVMVLISHLAAVGGVKPHLRRPFVVLVAIIFVIHPLQVESVAWVSASKVVLYASCTLAGLLFYVWYKIRRKYVFLLSTILCYVLGLMVKEQAIILPLNIILLDAFFHIFGEQKFTKKVWVEKIPFFIIAIGFWYWSSLHQLGVMNLEDAFPWEQRLVFGSYSLVVYLIRFIIPAKLLFYYGFPILAGEALPWTYYVFVSAALFVLMYLIDLYRQRKWAPFFGLLFFLINILLVLHIIPMPRAMITADRYMYLSIIGLAVWALWFAHKLTIWMTSRSLLPNLRSSKTLMGGLIGLYLLGFGWYSNSLTHKWNDSVSIKQELRDYIKPQFEVKIDQNEDESFQK